MMSTCFINRWNVTIILNVIIIKIEFDILNNRDYHTDEINQKLSLLNVTIK